MTTPDEIPNPNIDRDRMLAVADYIEAHPDHYNQLHWEQASHASDCGTTWCIAGVAIHLEHPEQEKVKELVHREREASYQGVDYVNVSDYAAGLLGLTEDQAVFLFAALWIPHGGHYPRDVLYDPVIQAKAVAEALRGVADGASVYDVGSIV